MKKLKNFVALFTILTLCLVGCDYVAEPFANGGGGIPIDTAKTMRNILIEDFTGQRCNNCPKATDEIKTIKGLPGYEGRVISVAVHTGFFAVPIAPPFDTDFRTDEGNTMESFFTPGGYPTGMVNRKDYPNDHFKSYTSWADETSGYISEEASLNLDITSSYNESNREASITVESNVKNDIVGDHNIVLLLTEDSIISPQVTPTGNDLNYIHNYVLRTSANSIWGEAYVTGSAAIGDELQYSGTITLDQAWTAKNCNIVAFVYDVNTQEVIQVDQIELTSEAVVRPMRNILIEDFTGQRCNNCPKATDEIKVIKALPGYEDRVISVAIHTGFFAVPIAVPFDTDYRTPEGNALESFFTPGGYPTGMVNRKDFPSDHFKSYTAWANETSNYINQESALSISIGASYNSLSREATIDVSSEFFEEVTGDQNIVVLLTEDKIISPQVTPTGNDLSYEHNYVLRTSSNSIWGEPYVVNSASIGDLLSYNTKIILDQDWNEQESNIVVFVYDTNTQEILHVNQIELIP